MRYLFGYCVENVPWGAGGKVEAKIEADRPVRRLAASWAGFDGGGEAAVEMGRNGS